MKKKQVFLSLGELSLVLDVDERTIRRWVHQEYDPLPLSFKAERPGQHNKYDAAQIFAWFVRKTKADLHSADEQEFYDYELERARLTHEQADKVTLENAQLRDELIPAPLVLATWKEGVANMRGRLLGLPTKVAPAVQGCDDLGEVRAILTDAVHEALDEIAINGLPAGARARIDDAVGKPEDSEAAT